jgi:thiamine transporter
MLSLEIAKKYDTAYLDDKWVSRDITSYVFLPILITMIIALLGGIALFIISKKKPSLFKTTALIVGGLCLAGIIVSLILVYVFYSNNIVDDGYYTAQDYGRLNNLALYGFSAILVISSIVVAFLLGKNDKSGFDTRCISIAGVCVALSFALSYIKLYEMPYGGSVTLFSMLPVMIFAFVYGTKKGLLIGLLYGILQAIQDPFIIHPAQFLLDYPIAFAMMGFAGSLTGFKVLDKRPQIKFCVSAIIGGTLRYICHVLSGVFAFGAWTLDAMYKSEGIFAYRAPAGDAMTNFWIYSLAYNSYVFIDILLVIVAGVFLFSSKAFRKEVEKLKPLIEEK